MKAIKVNFTDLGNAIVFISVLAFVFVLLGMFFSANEHTVLIFGKTSVILLLIFATMLVIGITLGKLNEYAQISSTCKKLLNSNDPIVFVVNTKSSEFDYECYSESVSYWNSDLYTTVYEDRLSSIPNSIPKKDHFAYISMSTRPRVLEVETIPSVPKDQESRVFCDFCDKATHILIIPGNLDDKIYSDDLRYVFEAHPKKIHIWSPLPKVDRSTNETKWKTFVSNIFSKYEYDIGLLTENTGGDFYSFYDHTRSNSLPLPNGGFPKAGEVLSQFFSAKDFSQFSFKWRVQTFFVSAIVLLVISGFTRFLISQPLSYFNNAPSIALCLILILLFGAIKK